MAQQPTALIACLLSASALVGQQAKVTKTREFYPVDYQFDEGEQRWNAARIVDGITGLPIPGAELLLVAESEHPIRGEFWWQRRAVADADGFVRIRTDEAAPDHVRWHWTIIRAPGYGPATWCGAHGAAIVRLAPAETMPVRIVDWCGRPVPDALVGFCGGCGHTPDLSWARTNAQGLALLDGVDPHNDIGDLYVEHPELHLGYRDFDWFRGEPPVTFAVRPAVAIEGTLIDADGQPIAGAFVGVRDVHRGPWTRTNADGTFRLCGAEHPGDDLYVFVGERQLLFEPPHVRPFVLRVPPPNGDDVQVVNLPEPAGCAVTVLFAVVDGDGDEIEDVRCVCIGPLPDRIETRTRTSLGKAEVDLQPGTYEVRVAARDSEESLSHVQVTADGDGPFTITLQPSPKTTVEVVGMPEEGIVELRTANWRIDITDEVRAGRPVGVPSEPFCFAILEHYGEQRVFPFDRATALAADPVRLSWFATTTVEGSVVDDRGTPLAARVALIPAARNLSACPDEGDFRGPAATFSLTTGFEGRAFLCVEADTEPRHRRIVPVDLPPRSGDVARVDVGAVRIGAPTLRFEGAGGQPLTGVEVAIVRRGWCAVRSGLDWQELDAGGGWRGTDPQTGDAFLVRTPHAEHAGGEGAGDGEPAATVDQPVRFVIEGAGPWTLRMPAGELLLDVKTPAPAFKAAIVGEHYVDVREPTLLRGLRPGAHRVFVCAEGCEAAIVDVVVPETGRATVAVELAER
jgi:hypothetical protein